MATTPSMATTATKSLPHTADGLLPATPPITDVENVVRYWLGDLARVVRLLAAAVIANLLDGDPLWLFLIAPPGGGKTELLRALSGIPAVYPLSNLTPQTFLSGKEGSDASLLPKVSGKVLVLKDFTTVLTMHRDRRGEILAQLREIYDGTYVKAYGTGKVQRWTGRVGLIAGVTPVIDTFYSFAQVLGERFILFRLDAASDEIKLARSAMRHRGHEAAMRQAMADTFARFFAGRQLPQPDAIGFPDVFEEEIAALAAFTVRARSGVLREPFSTREIELVPSPESPTRLAKQLAHLAIALAIVSDEQAVSAAHVGIVSRIALDCIPQPRRQVLGYLIGQHVWTETPKVAEGVDYPTSTCRRILQDLCALGVVAIERGDPGKPDRWRFSEAYETPFRAAQERARGSVPEKSTPSATPTLTTPTLPLTAFSGTVCETRTGADDSTVSEILERLGITISNADVLAAIKDWAKAVRQSPGRSDGAARALSRLLQSNGFLVSETAVQAALAGTELAT